MIIDWLLTLRPAAARRVTIVYFPAVCWSMAALAVWKLW